MLRTGIQLFSSDIKRLNISVDTNIRVMNMFNNVRICLVMFDPDMSMEISIDFLLKWQNRSCSVIFDLAMCIEIP